MSRVPTRRQEASNNGGLVPSPERFAVVRRLLEKNGWRLVRVNGSHHIFKKVGAVDVVLPVHRGRVKPYYVRQVREITQGQGD